MTGEQLIKQKCLELAAGELKLLFTIIGKLGYDGYQVSIFRIKGRSYSQCSARFNIPRSVVRRQWKKCQKLGYDADLKRIFKL